ncbi:MAG: type I methionyl aminopeptidase [Bacteroidia bacterium]|jgi:methionyl aminopeptidase|nr:type I methionyl aminopeptidase [Bacteroidia bacterium]
MAAIELKTVEEIELQRESSLLVGKTLAEVARHIRPGVTTLSLDRIAESFIRDHGAIPGFKGYGGFPGSLCISVNDEVVHGIPGKRELRDGDIVSVDCGVLKNGFYGDSAYTFAVGDISPELRLLLDRTLSSLYEGIKMAVDGNRVGDISFAIQNYIDQFGYGIVRELVGHGVGRKLHEAPEVPNFGRRGAGPRLQTGMVIAIEPMINLGTKNITQDADGWTIRTSDRRPSAHFEHTVAIGKEKADILSSFEMIEEVLKNTF